MNRYLIVRSPVVIGFFLLFRLFYGYTIASRNHHRSFAVFYGVEQKVQYEQSRYRKQVPSGEIQYITRPFDRLIILLSFVFHPV